MSRRADRWLLWSLSSLVLALAVSAGFLVAAIRIGLTLIFS